MINKLTIESRWKTNPHKTYFVIQNPKVDPKTKKVRGLHNKIIEYKVRDWTGKVVNFERVDKTKDKRFPEILVFDKRFPDATNEVYCERVSTAVNKPDAVDSYAIFEEKDQADFNKLMRIHRFAQAIMGLHEDETKKIQKAKNQGRIHNPGTTKTPSKQKVNNTDKSPEMNTGDTKKRVKPKEVFNLTVEELEDIFETVDATNYYDRLEEIQEKRPDLAIM